jgi:hypothetical protein
MTADRVEMIAADIVSEPVALATTGDGLKAQPEGVL